MDDSGRDHTRISPTGKTIAFFRSFSDMPYAKAISAELKAEDTTRQVYGPGLEAMTMVCAPLAEARYRCFRPHVDSYKNVLELAVGASVERGIAIAEDPDRIYVGVDLPEVIEESKALVEWFGIERPNLSLAAANVLSAEELDLAVADFGDRHGLAIINEGLLMYLTHEEKVLCAENVRRILKRYGGVWITPDVDDFQSVEMFMNDVGPDMSSMLRGAVASIETLSRCEISKNLFSSRQEAVDFFRTAGFRVKQYPMIESLDRLSSAAKLWDRNERIRYGQALLNLQVWIMDVAD